jgi:hypothetical protein
MGFRSVLWILALWGFLATGCVTPVTEADLEVKLKDAGATVSGLGRERVIPIYAESKTAAWTLLAEAKLEPDSRLSAQIGKSLELATRRGMSSIVGGPYPALSDQVVRNAFALQRDGDLSGLTVVFVSPRRPSQALVRAAARAKVRLHYRALP